MKQREKGGGGGGRPRSESHVIKVWWNPSQNKFLLDLPMQSVQVFTSTDLIELPPFG